MAVEVPDAIIVGGGPAGSATAVWLARSGLHVLVLERREFPRSKPCGDCLSPAATPILERLGVLPEVLAARPARLSGWRIVAPDGHGFSGVFQPVASGPETTVALALPRDRLDAILLAAAARAGAVVRTGAHVTDVRRDADGTVSGVSGRFATGESFRLRARLVVGANGLRSVVARRLGWIRRKPRLRKLSLTMRLREASLGPGNPAIGELHLGNGCCAGLAPIGEAAGAGTGPANLTLVVRGDDVQGRDPRAGFWDRLATMPALAPRLPELREAARHEAASLLASGPFDWPTRRVVGDGAALVGDAAGYFDPFTGQGIFQALAGAEHLGLAAVDALRRGVSGPVTASRLRAYARAHNELTRGARIVQRAIEWVTAHPHLANHALRRLNRASVAADALVAVTGDLQPARNLLLPRVLLSFILERHPTGGGS